MIWTVAYVFGADKRSIRGSWSIQNSIADMITMILPAVHAGTGASIHIAALYAEKKRQNEQEIGADTQAA